MLCGYAGSADISKDEGVAISGMAWDVTENWTDE